MSGLAILRNLLLKEAAIESGKRSGIAQIGNVTRDIAEKKFQAFVLGAKRQGVDLDKYTEQELKYILELNKPKKPRVISADSPEGKGLINALNRDLGKNVIKADFGKPFAKEVESMQDIADARLIKDMYRTAGPRNLDEDAGYLAEFIAEDAGKIFDDLPAEQQRIFRNRAKKALRKNVEKYKKDKLDPEDMATGGRVGLKAGMSKRAFLKLMGGAAAGIGALKTGALKMFGKGAAPVVEKTAEAASGAPSYFFDLVNKIKILGKQRQTPSYKERVNEYTYTGKNGIEYELVEDLNTGDIKITKDKLGGRSYGDESYETIEDRTEMVFTKGQMDETTKGKKPPDEYEEYKVEFDQDGTAADATDIDEISKKEIIEEVSGETPSIKKAGGGIARMLGE